MKSTLSERRRNALCGRCCYTCSRCVRNFLDDDPVFVCSMDGQKMEYSVTLKMWCKDWKSFGSDVSVDVKKGL